MTTQEMKVKSGGTILLVDDDAAFRRIYVSVLREAGYSVEEADDRQSARSKFRTRVFDAVLLDLMLPPDGSAKGGLKLLEELLTSKPGSKVIVVSGAGDARHMIEAVRAGAFDFLTKPADPDVLLIVVDRAITRVRLERQLETLQAAVLEARPDSALIGENPLFLRAVELADRIAPSDLPVLITGENGTGKELFARRLHQKSRRAAGRFVPVNCGALSEALLESSLFGHIRGSFTGAVRDRDGLFLEANGGTLFLDEVGDMPATLQVKLLRALELGEILPVGSDKPSHVDVRVVSATHKDLRVLQAAGTFREDLFWRINGTEIKVPALRDRPSDIPLLAAHFVNLSAHITPGGCPKPLSERAREAIVGYPWPGNLRELRHQMQRATVLAGGRATIEPEDFSFEPTEVAVTPMVAGSSLPEKVEALERTEIAAALGVHNGNRSHTAAALGLSRQGLLKKMDRFGLS